MSALGHNLNFTVLGATGGTTTLYVTAPFDLVIKDMKSALSADQTTAETITLSEGTTTVGVATFGANAGAGAALTYVADTTDGQHKFDSGDRIKVVVSQLQAAAIAHGTIIVDPYCRVTQTSS